MSQLIITKSDCTRCGLCARACPYGVLGVDDEGAPIVLSQFCIRCGHCTAVCPTGAMDHSLVPISDQISINPLLLPDADHAEHLLLTRRSIREFYSEPVPEDMLTRLLSVARYAPTGANMQGVQFHVISQKEILKKISTETLKWAQEELRQQTPFSGLIAPILKSQQTTGGDVILRDTPCLVLSLLPQPIHPGTLENGRFPLVYAQIFASALGLGSCWAGILEQCIHSGYAPVLELLALPEGTGFAGAMILGFPRFAHLRIPTRNPLYVTWLR